MACFDVDFEERLRQVVVPPGLTISLAVPILDRAGLGILLVCDEGRKLRGVLTDGNIRRALLRSESFNKPCTAIATRDPLVAGPDVSPGEALHLMDHGRPFTVNHLPLVDEGRRVTGLVVRRDVVNEEQLGLSAVIMAGGFGKRLSSLTEALPKPMLPVGGRPLLQHIIDQLREAGVRHVHITTHYRHDKITDYFGDGQAFGVDLRYVTEDQPLGTAGALGSVNVPDGPLLVINGDLLTDVDVRAMLAYHREQGADFTVAMREYGVRVPYGVLDCDGPRVCRVREKPRLTYMISGGIYLLEPAVRALVRAGARCDMPDLIQRLIDAGRRVVGFPIREYWLDIGRQPDYERALEAVASGHVGPVFNRSGTL